MQEILTPNQTIMKRIIITLFMVIVYALFTNTMAQGVAINGNQADPHPSAILDITSTEKGLLIPRMTMAERNLISSPAEGLIILQTDNNPGLYNYTGTGWEIIGKDSYSLNDLSDAGTTSACVFLGATAGNCNGTGDNNFASGSFALSNLSAGTDNIAIGGNALLNATNEAYNIAIGSNALADISNSGYSNNVAIGVSSLQYLVTGSNNTALGYLAMQGIDEAWTGSDNTGIGAGALSNLEGGSNNIGLGNGAGSNITTGSNNIVIGGSDNEVPTPAGNNQLNIGNLIYGTGLDGTGSTLSTGNIGIGVTNPTEKLHVAGQIRIEDGHETTGYVLVTDEDGVGTWTDPSSIGLNPSLAFGEMYEYTALSSQATEIEFLLKDVFIGWTTALQGELNNVSFASDPTANQLIISEAGSYQITAQLSFTSETWFTHPFILTTAIFVNGVKNDKLSFYQSISNIHIHSSSILGIVSLSSGDIIDLRFTSSQDTEKIEIFICNLNIVKLD